MTWSSRVSLFCLYLNIYTIGTMAHIEKEHPDLIIVGGAYAQEGKFPFYIQLEAYGLICGGSILSEFYVITAQHCVDGREADEINILVGSIKINKGERLAVAEIKRHPYNDIAVLRLHNKIQFNDCVKPIELFRDEVPGNSIITIIGLGRTSKGGSLTQSLKFVELTALSTDECRRVHPDFDDIICVSHGEGSGACNGDSGGPAIYEGKLVGIAFVVFAGCGSTSPDGYSSIHSNYDWIVENIELKRSLIKDDMKYWINQNILKI